MTAKHLVSFFFLGAIAYVAVRAEWSIGIAMIAVAIIALLIIVDGIFFEEEIYSSPLQPTVISGVLQGLPLLLIPFVAVSFSLPLMTAVAFGAGMTYTYAFSLYFRSLDIDKDMVVISVMWNIMIGLVPLAAFFAVKEDLSWVQYAGIGLIFFGAMVASYQKAVVQPGVIGKMLVAVLLLTLDEVALKWVYVGFNDAGLHDDSLVFWSGALPHSAGAMFVGLLFFRKLSRSSEDRAKFLSLLKRFWPVFLLIEAGQSAADLMSNYAISIGDVSIINAISGALGIFTAGISILVALFLSKSRVSASTARIRDEQFECFSAKLVGMVLITAGAYLVA